MCREWNEFRPFAVEWDQFVLNLGQSLPNSLDFWPFSVKMRPLYPVFWPIFDKFGSLLTRITENKPEFNRIPTICGNMWSDSPGKRPITAKLGAFSAESGQNTFEFDQHPPNLTSIGPVLNKLWQESIEFRLFAAKCYRILQESSELQVNAADFRQNAPSLSANQAERH